MKSSLFFVLIVIVTTLVSTVSVSAETWTTNSGSSSTGSVTKASVDTDWSLLVDSITSIDDAHIVVEFNQEIITESVRVRITRQDDDSNVRIESFTWTQDPQSINIILSDILEPDTSYKMTIISAISQEWVIIKDGADGLKEFTTPEDLAKFAPVELNAPTNPNAVIVTGTGIEVKKVEVKAEEVPAQVKNPSETAVELPLSWMDSTIFFLLASILALGLILRKKRV